ncbi:VOC family protein [Bradyrhizobium sp. 31Argb]|uniref:VOC family protein n=1 Tax=Bradyrhizobium sp. 31Argb TaxID=3141247 RepID=UPI003748C697
MSIQLDHVVINTQFETDTAAQLFEGLGFQLTPRGFHPTLGSVNHLMVFEHAYLELIGLPRGGDHVRQELIDSPIGLNGLVFASEDAAATRDAVVRAGFDAQPVQNFARPLTIDGREYEARGTAGARFVRGRTHLLLPASHA